LDQRWAIWFAIEGDLRFCSHHDLLRTMERLATRAHLPLRYSQGFNPRPRMSLVCPRPVGVSAPEDLLVAVLESPGQAPAGAGALCEADLLEALNRQAVPGLRFLRARPMTVSGIPRPVRITYELPLRPLEMEPVRARLGELALQGAWPVERLVTSQNRRQQRWQRQPIDIKPLIEQVDLAAARLRWVARRRQEAWARPGELLALVGLDSRSDVARVVRTLVTYENDPLSPAPSAPTSSADASAAEKGNEQRNPD